MCAHCIPRPQQGGVPPQAVKGVAQPLPGFQFTSGVRGKRLDHGQLQEAVHTFQRCLRFGLRLDESRVGVLRPGRRQNAAKNGQHDVSFSEVAAPSGPDYYEEKVCAV